MPTFKRFQWSRTADDGHAIYELQWSSNYVYIYFYDEGAFYNGNWHIATDFSAQHVYMYNKNNQKCPYVSLKLKFIL